MKLNFFSFPLCALLALGACAVGPDYQKPDVTIPTAYKEQQGIWKPAQPQNATSATWWTIYNDPALNALVSQVSISNQNLKASEAAYRQARALTDEARAGLFPTVGLDAGATRSKTGGSASHNNFSTSLSANWELDVWGSIRRNIESAEANAEASAADLAAARLSAQAEVASDYLELRVQDEQKRLLEQTVQGYQESLTITQNQYKTGVVAKTDVMQAETQLKSAQANLINLGVRRAQLEHAVAVLIGKAPSELTIEMVKTDIMNVPDVPPALPSLLLERRPDIASSERSVASANARIGVAIGAFFPDITLGGSYGFASAALSGLLKASSNIWSVGPSLALTLFDGGARAAQVDAARAEYDQAVANYRQTVLTAFQDVEDQLASMRILGQQAVAENETVKAAEEAEKLVHNQYKAGLVPYTTVVVAETAALGNEQSALSIKRDRLLASVSLIRALGGGWDTSQIPAEATSAMAAKNAPAAPAIPSAPAPAMPAEPYVRAQPVLPSGVRQSRTTTSTTTTTIVTPAPAASPAPSTTTTTTTTEKTQSIDAPVAMFTPAPADTPPPDAPAAPAPPAPEKSWYERLF